MSDFLENQLSNRNSDGTMPSSTFNSIYWGMFLWHFEQVLGSIFVFFYELTGFWPLTQGLYTSSGQIFNLTQISLLKKAEN